MPPNAVSTAMPRERDRKPPPHDLLHMLHDPHAVSVQSIGQMLLLHCCVSETGPHTFPPLATAVVTARVRACVPPPQDTLHWPQPPQSASTQSRGHACALHVLSSAYGHSKPPCIGSFTTTTSARCVPLPQDLVHDVHGSQAEYGHAQVPSWHDRRLSDTALEGALPPQLACLIVRVRTFSPPVPHVLVHAPHGPQTLTTPSIGQQWSLHARVSARYGHT